MSSQAPILEWQVVLDDAEWGRTASLEDLLDAQPTSADLPRSAWPFPWWLRLMAGVLCFLILAGGGYLWHFANLGAKRIDQEVRATVSAETWSQTAGSHLAARSLVDHQAGRVWQRGFLCELDQTENLTEPFSAPYQAEVRDIALRSDIAMAEMTVTGLGGTQYRELRFYRTDSTEGWLRTAPDAGFWGPQQTIETDQFHLVFRTKDAGAVMQVASKLDAIYARLRQDVGLPPDPQKMTVVVSPVSLYHLPDLVFKDDQLVVHSPYLLQAPLDLPDEAVLLKSIVNPLVVRVLLETTQLKSAPPQWRQVVGGLLLWEAYVGSNSLTPWYRDAVSWHYQEARAIRQRKRPPSLDDLALLCREYRVWRYALPIGLRGMVHPSWLCHDAYWPSQLVYFDSLPEQLNDLLDDADWELSVTGPRTNEWVKSLAASTLVDYIVTTYGRERLPALVTGIRPHDNWNTLAPKVFGVSVEELEIGWQTYLAEQYGDPSQ